MHYAVRRYTHYTYLPMYLGWRALFTGTGACVVQLRIRKPHLTHVLISTKPHLNVDSFHGGGGRRRHCPGICRREFLTVKTANLPLKLFQVYEIFAIPMTNVKPARSHKLFTQLTNRQAQATEFTKIFMNDAKHLRGFFFFFFFRTLIYQKKAH